MRRTAALAAGSIGILLLAVVFAPVPGGKVWISRLHDAAHGPVFGIVAVLLVIILRRRESFAALAPLRQYSIACAAASALGLLTEFAQIPVGREASWMDASHDVVGAAAFLACFAAFDLRRSARACAAARTAVFALGLVVLGYLMAPLARAALEYQQRRSAFPVLADFSGRFDAYFMWRIGVLVQPAPVPAHLHPSHNESAARVRFLAPRCPALNFHEPWPDWRGYSRLAIEAGNPTDATLDLVVRVHDAQHDDEFTDRYNGRFTLAPHARAVLRIPLHEVRAAPRGRSMDMSRIAGVVIFRDDGSAADEMYLWRMWLE